MFVYTVYPRTVAPRKQAARRVRPVSRVKAVGPVERGWTGRHDIVTPPQQAYELQEVTRRQSRAPEQVNEIGSFQITGEQNSREWPIGELYIQNMLPLLMLWRRPKTVIANDFIEKHQDRLHAVQARHNRRGRSRRWYVHADKNGVFNK